MAPRGGQGEAPKVRCSQRGSNALTTLLQNLNSAVVLPLRERADWASVQWHSRTNIGMVLVFLLGCVGIVVSEDGTELRREGCSAVTA